MSASRQCDFSGKFSVALNPQEEDCSREESHLESLVIWRLAESQKQLTRLGLGELSCR
jgi:hypothetical protein